MLSSVASAFFRPAELWWAAATVLLALFLATLVPFVLDTRTIGGERVWAKPLKFELSLALHFATLALALGAVDPALRTSPWLQGLALAAVAAALFEIGYIGWQAALGQRSHFNLSTPFNAAMYALMALGAVVIVAAALGVGALAALRPAPHVPPALRDALALGLIGGAILTLVVGFAIGGRLDRHVGIEPPHALRVPLFGWSLAVGDLRIAHFFATHTMQAIPLVGLVAVRVLPGPVVWMSAIAWTGLTLWLFRTALAGRGLGAYLGHAGPG